jgi:hypothetical protein
MNTLRMRLLKWIATLFVMLDGALIAGGAFELGAQLLQRIV